MKKSVIIWIIIAVLILALGGFLLLKQKNNSITQDITTFEECVDAGNPVMESYPRQCIANNQTFVEEIEENEVTYCLPEDRDSEICTYLYAPVCATIEINCTSESCEMAEETFSNPCVACSNSSVISYVQGEC